MINGHMIYRIWCACIYVRSRAAYSTH